MQFANKIKIYISITTLILVFSLIACSRNSIPYFPLDPNLPCKVDCASDEQIMLLQRKLEQCGVKVITMGQNYLVSIPSSIVFHPETPRIQWGSYPLLNDVACYLKQFRQVAIQITAYSNKCVSYRREKALTLTRARAIGDYLWSQGIDSRFLFTTGLGSDKPIMSYSNGGDLSPNSRIEITFRRTLI